MHSGRAMQTLIRHGRTCSSLIVCMLMLAALQVTDEDLKAWIRRNAEPTFHAVGLSVVLV